MLRLMLTAMTFAVATLPAGAHFVWIAPDSSAAGKAQVVFSDSLEPDEGVSIEKIAATKLWASDAAGKLTPLTWKKGEHAYLLDLPSPVPPIVGGTCIYGVLQKGDAKPFLLTYSAKMMPAGVHPSQAWKEVPLEILPRDKGQFQVMFDGEPAAQAEVTIIEPEAAAKKSATDAKGHFTFATSAPGTYAVRVRHIVAKSGEHDGKKYDEARYYTSLVIRVPKASAGATTYPALPRAVSSFGAAALDGWLYVYGGHCAKTHSYSTEAVVGTFHRLSLAEPKAWQPLPGGPGLQGLAVVAHGGKIYRIGGMHPRNAPGDKADNHSIATCARFDPALGKWEPLPDLPEPRSSHDAIVAGDKLIVAGGWKLNGAGKKSDWATTALVLDLGKQPLQWQSIPQPFERRALIAAVHEGKVYIIGGIGPDGAVERTVDLLDPSTLTWSSGPSIPGANRNGFSPAAAPLASRLYVAGADGKVVRLALKGDAWEPAGQLQQPRIVHRMVAAPAGRLVVLGGAHQGENIALVEALVP